MLLNRQKLILKAVIENYSQNTKPVSSELLTKLPYLNFSSATMRYEMARLEEKGYLQKSHKSSGRIPSIKGYVFYLNNLITRKKDNIPLFSYFEKILHQKYLFQNKDKVIQKILKLLCDFTNYVTMNIGTDLINQSKINKLVLISVSTKQFILLVITDTGSVQTQNLFLDSLPNYTFKDLKKIILILNEFLINKYINEAIDILKSDFIQQKIILYIQYYEYIISVLMELLHNLMQKNSSYVYGLNNLLNLMEWGSSQTIHKLTKIFAQQEWNKIFLSPDKMICQLANQIRLTLYNELIIVSVPYEISQNEKGFIAILGPKNIKYQEIIPLLEYLSANLSYLYMKK